MASKRKSADPPPVEIRSFTLQEIDQGISKLKRRIDDVKRLLDNKVRYDDRSKVNVEEEIDRTIMEVFGINSPEYRCNRHPIIWHGGMIVSAFGEEPDGQGGFEAVFRRR